MQHDFISHSFRLFALVITCSVCSLVFAQAGEWTWVKGPQAPGGMGVYGTQGVAAAANHPPGCVNQFSWAALDGTFWIYGGQAGLGQALAALWKYDPATNMWTWMKGPSTFDFLGNFGTQGVPSPNNLPPAKTFGGASWVDLDGNFWMYSGENGDNYNNNANNDLWKYDPGTNIWTWMKGSTLDDPPAVWGTKGVPDINNQPPPHGTCYGTWCDNQGDLWMFGGLYNGDLDDLWRYNIATNTWTWMNGSPTPNAAPVYGTMGVQDAMNTPGGRVAYSLGKTPDGMLWMHGGSLGGAAYGYGDLWRLDPASGEWTWMSGSSLANPLPANGTVCVAQNTNDPGERLVEPTWQTADGRMWRCGIVSSSGFLPNNYDRSDLWAFCPTAMEWTWVHGPATNNVPGNWGTIGVSSPTNLPNGRQMASAWTSLSGDLYLFGGAPLGVFATYGDLWRFTPDSLCGSCSTITSVLEIPEESAQFVGDGRDMVVVLPEGAWLVRTHDATGRLLSEEGAVGRLRPSGLQHVHSGLVIITATDDRGTRYTRKVLLSEP